MKKIFALFLICIVVAAGVFLYNGQGASNNLPEAEKQTAKSAVYTPNQSSNILLINGNNPLPSNYKPENLINLYQQKGRGFQLAESDIEICQAVYEAMNTMFAAAKKDGVDGFIITSGYRSRSDQAAIFANSNDGTAARPGTSEHESGLAFDVTAYGNKSFELTPQFKWLLKHCGEYGFILRYLKGSESVTGYPFESWHYRYVGVPYAKEIMDAGITLEEYLEREQRK